LLALDTNILVYAHIETLPKHLAAKKKLKELAEGSARWGIPVFCIGEFLRVITHSKIFANHYSPKQAVDALSAVLSSPSLEILMPGEHYCTNLYGAMVEANVSGNLIFDAQVVALCRELGVSCLLTEDRDFHRFQNFAVQHL
jgi:toxin-antitoxin system PIN domain toxin